MSWILKSLTVLKKAQQIIPVAIALLETMVQKDLNKDGKIG